MLLPWLAANERLKGREMYECGACMRAYNKHHRKMMKCGHIPQREWLPTRDLRVVPGAPLIDDKPPAVCPGYTKRLPVVQEAARAWAYWEKGQLQLRHPQPTEMLMTLIDVFAGQNAMAQAWESEERRRKNG